VYGIVTYKKEIINKATNLGFQIGKKCLIAEIPKHILNHKNKEIIKAVLRGIFDADGSFRCEKSRASTSTEWKRTHNYHPELRITSCSKKLLKQIQFLLEKLDIESKIVQKGIKGIKNNRNINDSFALNIRKIKEIEKWFKFIGTNNPRHKTRYDVWKKIGYLPPNNTIQERIKILKSL
jgi:intein/homing endonuclease